MILKVFSNLDDSMILLFFFLREECIRSPILKAVFAFPGMKSSSFLPRVFLFRKAEGLWEPAHWCCYIARPGSASCNTGERSQGPQLVSSTSQGSLNSHLYTGTSSREQEGIYYFPKHKKKRVSKFMDKHLLTNKLADIEGNGQDNYLSLVIQCFCCHKITEYVNDRIHR